MSQERIANAMERIDRALGRIETQAALARHSVTGTSGDDADLAARHAALRTSVETSLAELDGLIESFDR